MFSIVFVLLPDDYDAILVAACGFRRGGLKARIDQVCLSLFIS
jgi:hypothetical protein